MLTNAAVRAARSRSRAYKMFDERGLFLFVAPTGLRAWRWKYRFEGREKLLTVGRWPEMQLLDARSRCDEARALLAQGVDPSGAPASAVQICTFESVARAWHDQMLEEWTDRHAADVLDSLARDVFPEIGALPLGAISSPMILQLLRDVEARGSIETARRIRQRISKVFRFAIAEGLTQHDPAAVVADALRAGRPVRRQPALVKLDEVRGLFAACCDRASGPPIVRMASRFLALTAVRMGALLGARWGEFEGLDGDEPLWRIPAARMKLEKAKKADPAHDHLVPLSAAAVRVLWEVGAHPAKGIEERGLVDAEVIRAFLVFPIPAAAIGTLYARQGYKGRHVPHGWRASFSTILNERFPEDRAAIDRALAHTPKDKVEAAYNRAEQLGRRRQLYERWADLIT